MTGAFAAAAAARSPAGETPAKLLHRRVPQADKTDVSMSVSVNDSPLALTKAPELQASPPAAALHETLIEPRRGWIGVNWRELIEGRELLFFFIWRDLKVRYKQALLGVGWVVIQPLMNMILFTIVFGNAAGLNKRLPGHSDQYGVYVYAALLPWQLFATSLSLGGMSLVNQQNIVKKIYFPRLYVPSAAVGGALVDMAISFVIVMALCVWNHIRFSLSLLLLPPLVALALLSCLGTAYLLSALTVKYRDFRFLIPFMSQVLMFASFVAFPPSLLGNSRWKWVLLANPMYGVVAGFRKCILGGFPDDVTGFQWRYIASSLIGGLLLFFLGIFVFRRTEKSFADIA